MSDQDLQTYLRLHTQPTQLHVEIAKRTILEHMVTHAAHIAGEPLAGSQLASQFEYMLNEFSSPDPIPAGYASLEAPLTRIRAERAGREALLSLHAQGTLISYGGQEQNVPKRLITVGQPTNHIEQESIQVPSIHIFYRLAAPYRGEQRYRLASTSVYISCLEQGKLPSRAKRCLHECIEAYRVGLYLSAIMSVGAASESLWMHLARLIYDKKPSVSNEVGKLLNQYAPSITTLIKESWSVITGHYDNELKLIFGNKAERQVFRDHADRLCDRRNYAMHNEDADEDEAMFSYEETGMLLLGSIRYFNQLLKLIEVAQ